MPRNMVSTDGPHLDTVDGREYGLEWGELCPKGQSTYSSRHGVPMLDSFIS
jgi:hypothetical protein